MNHSSHESPRHRERLLNLKEPTVPEDSAPPLSLAELGDHVPSSPDIPEPSLLPEDGE